MSRWKPKRPSSQDTMRDLLGPLDGARIPGGCDHCNAWQTVEPIEAGAWRIAVHHDDWCPWFRRHEGGAS